MTVRLIVLVKNNRLTSQVRGGYFFALFLLLMPIEYLRPNEVRQILSTAIRSLMVIITRVLLSIRMLK